MSYNYIIIIDSIQFEWNPEKAKTNLIKHGISFEEAATVFDDNQSILFDDPNHSDEEERLLVLGFSKKGNMLIVCHCIRKENVIRIISARKATKSEREVYEEENQ